jgi:hypothetical protein
MQLISNHLVLVSAPDFESACIQVNDFFDKTLLVRYDKIDIQEKKCHSGNDPQFKQALQNGIEVNKTTLNKFIGEFKNTGFKSVEDLKNVECGYQSKLLHIITHFLDGFIGIDSTFYNLTEDSHWISQNLLKEIDNNPKHYWLIQLDCFSESPEKVSLVQM